MSADECVHPEPISIADPERTSLLGLLMRDMIATRLQEPRIRDRIRGLNGDIQVQAGEMTVTLRSASGLITIVEGPSHAPKASVKGTMPALLSIATGGGMIGPFLAGQIRASGNLLMLIRILPLIRGGGSRPTPSARNGDRS